MAALPLHLLLVFLQIFSNFAKSISNDEYLIDADNFEDPSDLAPRVEEDLSFLGFPQLKQVSAVAVCKEGNLHVFHRGDRVWGVGTFDLFNRLTKTSQGPISNDTVIVINPMTGEFLHSWGSNRFYMPHGLTVDDEGNSYTTDAGLHQVMKFPPNSNTPEIIIGEAFTPGSGRNHLCKPTDVAVTKTGHFFVSDGYCNSRILMFSKSGRLLKEIGSTDGMLIPHSLTLVPEQAAVCVADRENGRVLCYSSGTDGSEPGNRLFSIEGQGLGRVFAIDTRGKQLFVVNGPDMWENTLSVSADHGLVIDIETGTPKTIWGPDKGFKMPHDLAVSPDGKFVYVAEIDQSTPKRVYKFNIFD